MPRLQKTVLRQCRKAVVLGAAINAVVPVFAQTPLPKYEIISTLSTRASSNQTLHQAYVVDRVHSRLILCSAILAANNGPGPAPTGNCGDVQLDSSGSDWSSAQLVGDLAPKATLPSTIIWQLDQSKGTLHVCEPSPTPRQCFAFPAF